MRARTLLSRRHFVRAGAAALAGLPFLRTLGARADAGLFPTRLVLFFSGCGTHYPDWAPRGGETDFVLSPILEPLAPFRSKLLVVGGLAMEAGSHGAGDRNHGNGINHVLTGIEWQEGQNGYGGPTVDIHVADSLAAPTRLPSLELGVMTYANPDEDKWQRYFRHMSARGPFELVPRIDDPYESFERLFTDLPEGDSFERVLLERRSVLDHVLADVERARAYVGAEERARIEAHLDAVREMERGLADGAATACAPPALGGRLDHHANDNFPVLVDAMIDQTAAALACDLTRVASIQCSKAVSRIVHRWLGITEDHHSISHENPSNDAARSKIVAINRWYAERFAYLLGRLDAVREGDGTVLDHSLVIWVNELGTFGPGHSREPMPYVLAGGANGALRTGRYLDFTGRQNNDLLISVCQAMGLSDTTYGNPEYCRGPLPLG